jgi:hypothetical protein
MQNESEQTPRAGQYKVWALLVATAVAAALLAYGRFMGDYRWELQLARTEPGALPAEWVMVIEGAVLALMIAAAARRRRIRLLFASAETMIWLAGVCLLTASLYHYPANLQPAHLTNHEFLIPSVFRRSIASLPLVPFLIKLLIARLPILIFGWPMVYGAIAMVTSFVHIMGWKGPAVLWRWTLPALILVFATGVQMALTFWLVKPADGSNRLMLCALPCLVLAAVVATIGFVRDPSRKIQCINLIAGLLLLRAFYPQYNRYEVALTFIETLRFTGQGYPLLVLGDLLLLAGSMTMLCTRKGMGST